MLFLNIFRCNPNYDYVDEVLVNINHHEGVRISTGTKKVDGAVLLYDHVKTYFDLLNEGEIIEVNNAHYQNIIRACMQSKGKRKLAINYFMKLIKNNNKINKQVVKSGLLILFGMKNIEKIKLNFLSRKVVE